MIQRIIQLCTLALIVAVDAGPLEPMIEIRPICRTTIEVKCSINTANIKLWDIYRFRDQSGDFQKVARIDYSKCYVTYLKVSETQCSCVETNGVICKMTVQSGDRWQCSVFVNGSNYRSKPPKQHSFEIDNIAECATTLVPDHVTKESSTVSLETNMNITDTEPMLKEVGENVTTESFKISKVQNVNTDAEIQQGSHNKPDNTLLVLIIAGPFVVFVIGLILFIYRKKLMSCSGGTYSVKQVMLHELLNEQQSPTEQHHYTSLWDRDGVHFARDQMEHVYNPSETEPDLDEIAQNEVSHENTQVSESPLHMNPYENTGQSRCDQQDKSDDDNYDTIKDEHDGPSE